ncbi:HIT family protein [Butyrivibrio sp. YAB3001]|uniref:HIT family protein n=1 Tax=Butyrivibrio sp. YAB3001 TaxID=1520812 RepID=UPI0008F67C4F|nr:HIT family protein [Butyrivibrio sp. YAB3001]SFC83301.1 histidine triad (HIT) family protein [Butyrivibrio sp. YAB3001]
MDGCIFCKIANGEIPSNTIFENDEFRVILDNGPATKGHALVLPKKHYADLFEIPEETVANAAIVAKKVAQNIKEKLNCDGLNLVQNNGATAGQTVMHFHLHIIPRYENDGQHILWKPTSPSAEELVDIKNKIVG